MNPEALRDFVRDVQNYLLTQSSSKNTTIFHEEAITGFATQTPPLPQRIGSGCT